MLPNVKSIGVIHEHFNQYVQREGSITSSIDKRIYNYIDNWNGIIEYYKKIKYIVDYEITKEEIILKFFKEEENEEETATA